MSLPKLKYLRTTKIAFALGGGGARGLAHLGVLKVLTQAGIQPDLIAGTSMGSIMGALYCHLQDAELAEKQVLAQLKHPKFDQLGLGAFFNSKKEAPGWGKNLEHLSRLFFLGSFLTKNHIITAEKFKQLLALLIPELLIENLNLPFAAVAADLLTGETFSFKHGPLAMALQASSAIPGVFPPLLFENRQLIDGAISALVPVQEARELGADIVIAIDVSPFKTASKPYSNGVEIWMRADQIVGRKLRNLQLENADAVIWVEPLDFEWHDFGVAEAIIHAGEVSALAALPGLLKTLRSRIPWWRRW